MLLWLILLKITTRCLSYYWIMVATAVIGGVGHSLVIRPFSRTSLQVSLSMRRFSAKTIPTPQSSKPLYIANRLQKRQVRIHASHWWWCHAYFFVHRMRRGRDWDNNAHLGVRNKTKKNRMKKLIGSWNLKNGLTDLLKSDHKSILQIRMKYLELGLYFKKM